MVNLIGLCMNVADNALQGAGGLVNGGDDLIEHLLSILTGMGLVPDQLYLLVSFTYDSERLLLHLADKLVNLVPCSCAVGGQLADVLGDNSEALPLFAGMCRFYGCIQG
ncbi:hypothetical protein D3C78_1456560 [compost metagenome]